MSTNVHQWVIILLLFIVITLLIYDRPFDQIILENYSVREYFPKSLSLGGPVKGLTPSERMINIFKSQVPERQAAIMGEWSKTAPSHFILYNNLVHEAVCDEFIRVGHHPNGAKWMCSPHELPDNCVMVTLGLKNDIAFEQHLQQLNDNRCKVVAFDVEKQTDETLREFMAINGFVTAEVPGKKTLLELVKQEKLDHIDVLKIDFSQMEESVLSLTEEYRISQILLQLQSPRGVYAKVHLLNALSKKGYWILMNEINGANHFTYEMSLIHESAFERYRVHPLVQYMNFTV